MVRNEGFDSFSSLKESRKDQRTWDGDLLHGLELPEEVTSWQRVYQRGMRMRRNLAHGRYQNWRLFLTGPKHLPVKNITAETSSDELQTAHEGSPFIDKERQFYLKHYLNKDYLVVARYELLDPEEEYQVFPVLTSHELFVWSWNDGRDPKFLVIKDILTLHPERLVKHTSFIYKKFLVFTPNIFDTSPQTSMIRVYDLSSPDLVLVSSYSLPEDAKARRVKQTPWSCCISGPHLCLVGDHALSLCHTPTPAIYIFSLPDCQLLLHLSFNAQPGLEILDSHDLSLKCFVVGHKILFMFADPEFFPDEGEPTEEKFGKLLQVDCEEYFKTGGNVDLSLDAKFESNLDQEEDGAMMKDNRMVSVLTSGRIIMKELTNSTKSGVLVTKKVWSLACPESLKAGDEVDGPVLYYNNFEDVVLTLRHFVSGRKMHAVSSSGNVLYSLSLESAHLGLELRTSSLSISSAGRFFGVFDQVDPNCLLLIMPTSSWNFMQ